MMILSQNPAPKIFQSMPNELIRALRYMLIFGLCYLVFIAVYSVFYHQVVAKSETQYIEHILWWLKLSGIWFLTAPLSLWVLTEQMHRRPLPINYLLLGVPLVCLAVGLQLIFDYPHYQHDIFSFTILFLPRQTAIFITLCLYWYLMVCLPTRQTMAPEINDDSNGTSETINVEHMGRPLGVPIESIYAIRSAGNYVEIDCDEGCFLKRSSLKQLQQELPSAFVQCHRSHIVNLRKVAALQNQANASGLLTLSNGQQLAVSKRHKTQVKQQLALYPPV